MALFSCFCPRHPALVLCIALLAAAAPVVSAQPRPAELFADARPADVPDDHTPRGALWRAAVVPGWGQIYNRQYAKLPLVYGGLGSIIYLTVRLTNEYVLYRHAALYAYYEVENDLDRFPGFEADYRALLDRFSVQSIQSATLRAHRDNLRRNRDLSLVGVGLVYGLTVLDAYVSAHLLDFDIDEDLSLGVHPAAAGVRAHLRLAL